MEDVSYYRERYDYNPGTGVLSSVDTGYQVGHYSCGYLVVEGVGIHRIAYLLMTNLYPDNIDHINHIKDDNRWDNIRSVTHQENMKNLPLYDTNTSGQAGVSWSKDRCRWDARINIDGKRKRLGYFVEYCDAVNARKNAEILYGYHTNHGE